ncbi:MAG: hypothetical protein JRC77_08070 [Deltaproteobacteria bacterium]|nr:hypothetical protein [Deltaproteobacteria bacterium]
MFLAVASTLLAKDDIVGFPRARVRWPTECSESGVCGEPVVLRRDDTVEVVVDGPSALCLCPRQRMLEVPRDALELSSRQWGPSVHELLALGFELRAGLSPKGGGEVSYGEVSKHGAELYLVAADLSIGTGLRLSVAAADCLWPSGHGRSPWLDLHAVCAGSNAQVGVSGTFFLSSGSLAGRPLGCVVSEGQVVFSATELQGAVAKRSRFLQTSKGKLETREWDEPMARDAHVVLGGLGRLIRSGDVNAWRS